MYHTGRRVKLRAFVASQLQMVLPTPAVLRGRRVRCPLDRKLAGSRGHSAGIGKKKVPPSPGFEPRTSRLKPVTSMTELHQLILIDNGDDSLG
jgi:hypothetical protein